MTQKKRNRKKNSTTAQGLSELRSNVAGIDLGSTEHWVCGPDRGTGEPNVRTFGTVTSSLAACVEWLLEEGVESVAMESTSVYWIPLYEMLEEAGLEVLLVNARQLHNVPGRKTDMADCQWLQKLHASGLLRGSFRPHESICALRTLQRQMSNLVEQRTRSVQWMQKSLDQMNILVHRAVTDITGKTGMAIVRAIVAGERDPMTLACLRDHRCSKSEHQIAEYLTGTWREEHIFNLRQALRLYDSYQAMIVEYEEKLLTEIQALQPPERRDQEVAPHPNKRKAKVLKRRGEDALREDLYRFSGVDLTRIDGLSVVAARAILTEIGPDLSAFPTEKHFVSWLRLSPKTGYSAGKAVRKPRNAVGATRVAGLFRMSALTLRRSPTALGAYYRRIARTKDGGVAVFATARKLATIVFRMLRYGVEYVDEGAKLYEERYRAQQLRRLKSTAKQLGYELTAVPAQG